MSPNQSTVLSDPAPAVSKPIAYTNQTTLSEPPETPPARDVVNNMTAAGLASLPSIRLLSVGRSRWTTGFQRQHIATTPSLVAFRTVSGGGTLYFMIDDNEHQVRIDTPSVLLFNDWELDRVGDVDDHWRIDWYEFASTDPFAGLLHKVIEMPWTEEENRKASDVHSHVGNSSFSERAYTAAQFSEMLFGWFRSTGFVTSEPDHQLLEKAMGILQSRIFEPTNVELIAAEVGVSAVKMRKLFRENLLMSPKQYFDRLRFEEARRLLQQGVLAKQVGKRLGFQNSNHFSKAFKAHVGLTIREYYERYCHKNRRR